MKTTKLTLIASLALALAIGAWSVQAAEKGTARGGAGDLIKQSPPASNPAPVAVMECLKCKTEWLVRTDLGARGANKPTQLVGRHLCEKCSTVLTTVGQGKQAKNVATHLCKSCGN